MSFDTSKYSKLYIVFNDTILSYKCVPVLTNSNTSSIIVLHIEYRICTLIKTTFR